MDAVLNAADMLFEQEVREFFEQHWTSELEQSIADPATMREGLVKWQNILYNKGWMAPAWPREFGGAEWSVTQSYIYNDIRGELGVAERWPAGVLMLGPILIRFGTDQQKQRFLPGILKSEDWWVQGYSEWEAGSDLAALQCSAVSDGDDYLITGCKTWVSYAQHANWIFCLVRTDASGPKQQGISFLLIELDSPGICIKPIDTIDGFHHLNEIQFENVRVPKANLVADEGMGWAIAKSLLVEERFVGADIAGNKRSLKQLKQQAAAELAGGSRLIDDPHFAVQLSELEISLMALEYTAMRVLDALAHGSEPGAESSLLKLQGTEIEQTIQELRMDLLAMYAGTDQSTLDRQTQSHNFAVAAHKQFFRGRAATIYGGSSEVQKNIIARHALGI